jgi:hypothetical protein
VKPTDDLLAIDDALTLLAAEDNEAAQFVKLRFYAGSRRRTGLSAGHCVPHLELRESLAACEGCGCKGQLRSLPRRCCPDPAPIRAARSPARRTTNRQRAPLSVGVGHDWYLLRETLSMGLLLGCDLQVTKGHGPVVALEHQWPHRHLAAERTAGSPLGDFELVVDGFAV